MPDSNAQYSLLEILEKGGWTMLPLVLCSVIAVAIILERAVWGPRRRRVIPEGLFEEVRELLRKGRFEEVVGLCRANSSAFASVILASLQHGPRSRAEIIEAVELSGRRAASQLQKNVGALGTIAAISPLLGLLGTVFGMISTFAVIQQQGVGDAEALAGGISEALITTAVGLTIAIPSLVFHRYYLQKTHQLVLEMEQMAKILVDELTDSPDVSERVERAQS